MQRRSFITRSTYEVWDINAAIRAFVRRALLNGDEVWGFRDGWQGVVFGRQGLYKFRPFNLARN
jgi:hypothetical protein